MERALKNLRLYRREIENAVYGGLGLLAFYFLIMRLTSGSWEVTLDQFSDLWPWMSVLVAGFAIQVGLYTRLRRLHSERMHTAVAGTSAATSGAAMVACCAHHAVDVLPILGLSGAAVFLAEYQVKFLILGALMNAFGVAYLLYQLRQVASAVTAYSSESVEFVKTEGYN